MPKFDQEQVRKGLDVEREHEDTWESIEPDTTMTEEEKQDASRSTVNDHLREDPKYYDKLELVEGEHFENPVRRKPDYGEAPFSAEELKAEEAAVVARLVDDYREGVLRELPLAGKSLIDVLAERGLRNADMALVRRIAEAANRGASVIDSRRRVAASPLGRRLASSFARAIEEGRLPLHDVYTRSQLREFVAGAVGDGPEVERLVDDVAIAHNIENDTLGVVESGASRAQLVSTAEADMVRSVVHQMGEFIEDQESEELKFYPTEPIDMWNVVRSLERQFPEMTAGVGEEGTELEHVWVREGREPTGSTREKWTV